jgi:hypothetical protein
MIRILSGAAAIAVALTLPAAASAAMSSPAQAKDTYTLRGVITQIDGKWDVTLHEPSGFIEEVALHPGTVVAPTGLRLAPGMQVSIRGYQDHATFDAVRIVGPADAQASRRAGGMSLLPEAIPNGSFETQGPIAAGGG